MSDASDSKPRAALERELAEAKALLASFQKRGTTLKVSAKGGVSVYGLSRFPVTLYKSQWKRLMAMKDAILAFIDEHDAELPVPLPALLLLRRA